MTIALSLLLALIPASVPDECAYEAERAATVDAAGARLLRVAAGAGWLRVEGRPGLTEVRVVGQACASDRELLDEIRLMAERRGGDVIVETDLPEGWFDDGEYARLNLTLEVPAGMAASIHDGSGSIEAVNLGALEVDDGSGELRIENAAGPVRIDDGSGEIEVVGVRGDVEIDDNSGSIEVRDVEGSVTLSDGSGEIRVEGVTGSVRVTRDGSGGIRVADVRGDFVVDRDGTGGIRHSNVAGTVRIPRGRW